MPGWFATVRAAGAIDIAEFASIAAGGLENAFEEWLHGEDADTETTSTGGRDVTCNIEATPLSKSRARSAHMAARIHAGLEWSSVTMRTTELDMQHRQIQVAEAALRLEEAKHKAATMIPNDTVRDDEVADAIKVREMPVMPGRDYGEALKLFFKLQRRGPFPSEEPDREQMTAILYILGGGGCCVDLALWGPRHIRMLRHLKRMGMVAGPKNILIHQEFKGPPAYSHWRQG